MQLWEAVDQMAGTSAREDARCRVPRRQYKRAETQARKATRPTTPSLGSFTCSPHLGGGSAKLAPLAVVQGRGSGVPPKKPQ